MRRRSLGRKRRHQRKRSNTREILGNKMEGILESEMDLDDPTWEPKHPLVRCMALDDGLWRCNTVDKWKKFYDITTDEYPRGARVCVRCVARKHKETEAQAAARITQSRRGYAERRRRTDRFQEVLEIERQQFPALEDLPAEEAAEEDEGVLALQDKAIITVKRTIRQLTLTNF